MGLLPHHRGRGAQPEELQSLYRQWAAEQGLGQLSELPPELLARLLRCGPGAGELGRLSCCSSACRDAAEAAAEA